MIDQYIYQLINYAISKSLIKETDKQYVLNQILDLLNLDEIKEENTLDINNSVELEYILENILDFAIYNKLISDNIIERDLFDTKLMNIFVARPSVILEKFNELYSQSPKLASEYYYDLSKNSNYIRTYRVKKDLKWKFDSEFGSLDISINLSKPEKDPKAIAKEGLSKSCSYPKCLLCKENEGYAGRINHPARQNLRLIPLKLGNSSWYMQYSPYVYYNEHCIIFNSEHSPMKISKNTFINLFDFIQQFPHYMLGSNADLPIVGGSILSHDHFQGGNYEFAMAKAKFEYEFKFDDFLDIKAGIIKWPMSVIRLVGKNIEHLIELSDKILNKWIEYTDEEADIYAYTDGIRHNTITPIARYRNDNYEIDLVLRNNICTKERPDGLYHPRPSLHHIKKENIGLIEVMGLAILPSRLKKELEILKEYILLNKDISSNEEIKKHSQWAEKIKQKYDDINISNIDEILKYELGLVFENVLKDAGVYKCDEKGRKAFLRFIEHINDKR